ncbi:preprotein translocase subunit YajC [Staphylococcus carnosus]|uniref:Preprotein translocase subunit YajC n=1 Tax=Staphylococcus carnosus TaxID=1281 RepID=A0AAJ0JQD9_STACA|nr:preprotein translocase subunit YajC [Staphylococcus carnosus]KKB26104.1 preprotein translocase subunit YajC [Staphylococcus carnosus]KOR13486.1 preprotein translocase subunit YajC [Staphylococcus carnosus]UTB80538.1 preprotein translocase subunit YajC [Staphylococcus carnosus]UTB82995.1 preprotein translocase subunit YajC [Staphylococcus carnosus]
MFVNLTGLILPIALLALMWFFMIRPQQKRQKEHREMINRLEAGQHVTTIGGIKGVVRSLDETSVVISVNDKGTQLTFEKPAIKQVNPD